MSNRSIFFRLGCVALLLVSSPVLLGQNRGHLDGVRDSSEEYRKLFSTLLNPNGIDFEQFGADSKKISVIGMFSDEKVSGSELQVMHWIDFKAPPEELLED
ncbi:hypothetical protein [Candidatus Similichlamydia laticola]|uniref:hypothetical protein n=1 Tax=Candidatus Similichlamydia laticola TaxID=2170265 RepID=UPI000DF7EF34|nr:hypothetical protein [Candidatus Similichlamydia laticola]